MVRRTQGAEGQVVPLRRRHRAIHGGISLSCAAAVLLISIFPAAAITGTVVDGGKDPIVGAHVCYMTGGVELLCLQTDSKGFYDLPTSEQDRIRIRKKGFLPKTLAAVDHEQPIVLDPAATLLVVLEDAETGERIPEGEIVVVESSGRKRGPFPSRTAGVRVNSLQPGEISLVSMAKGYDDKVSRLIVLKAGEETSVTVELAPQESSATEK